MKNRERCRYRYSDRNRGRYGVECEDASQRLLYHGAKKSKMTKNSNQGGPALKWSFLCTIVLLV